MIKGVLRKILHIVLIYMVLFIIIPSHAVASQGEKIIVKVGYDRGYGAVRDLESIDEKGYIYDLAKKMEYYSNLRFEYIKYDDLIDCFDALERGEVDVVGPVSYTQTRAEQYLYSAPIAEVVVSLVTKAEHTQTTFYDDYDLIDGKTVASYNGSPYEQYLDAYCEEKDIEITYIRGTSTSYKDLEADYYLTTSMFDVFADYVSVVNLKVENLHLAFSKNDDSKRDIVQEALTRTIAADKWLMSELSEKYYGKSTLKRRYITKTEQALLEDMEFTVGFDINHPPYMYLNDQGEPDGIIVNIFKAVAENGGFTNYTFQPYDVLDGDPSDEEYAYNTSDIILSAIGKSNPYEEQFELSDVIFQAPIFYITSINSYIESSSEPGVLGIHQAAFWSEEEIIKNFPNVEIKPYISHMEIIDDFNNGKLDAIMMTEYASNYAKAFVEDEYTTIASEGRLEFRLLVSKEIADTYVHIFNVLFDYFPTEKVDEIIIQEESKYFLPVTISEIIRENLLPILLGVILIVTVIVLIGAYENNKRKSTILEIVNKDELTGYISLFKFNEVAKEMLEHVEKDQLEVISVDIDRFTIINSMFGVVTGDFVIVAMANALEEEYGKKKGLVARITADHFVVIRNCKEAREIKEVISDVLIPLIREIIGEGFNLTLAAGVYKIENDKIELSEALRKAIHAKSMQKRMYLSMVTYYDEAMEKREKSKINVVLRMKAALQEKEFYIKFQPKVNFETLKVCGAEALVRWKPKNSDREIYPDEFIPIFESNGFIKLLDYFVFEEACRFRSENYKFMKVPIISTNISTVTLFDVSFTQSLDEILKRYELHPQDVELEITESVAEQDKHILSNKIRELKHYGYTISIDDFGSGVSSLNRLASLDVDILKLDKEFLDCNFEQVKGTAIINKVIELAKSINMTVVCEGVETAEQAKWLQSIYCDVAQGYYFSRPIEMEEFRELLLENKTFLIEENSCH